MKNTKEVNLCVLLLLCMLHIGSCKDSNDDDGAIYDPSKPVELLSFYPDSGKYLEKVILKGTNFGSNVEDIKVYFNTREAAVIGSTGENIYVLAPRLPGDTCIISVVVGKDSLSYPNIFKYSKSVTVTTIAGNGNMDAITAGSLGGTSLQPYYLCVDKDDNIFVISRNGNTDDSYGIARIDEEADELIMVSKNTTGNVPCADPTTGIITIPTETTIGSYLSLDPLEFWAPRYREMKWPEGYAIPAAGWKHCMVVNPEDGYIYTRYYYGDLIKINPKTYEVTPLMKTDQGDSYGLTFTPQHPNLLYISFWGNSGVNANSICTVDVTDPKNTFKRITSSVISGGHRDGVIENAQFRNPAQIFCDNDGNIYVADCDNHCIRRITVDGMVETVLGMPGTSGWKDGTKEEALFCNPRGIGISKDGTVYVADFGNGRVRKLSIN